MIRHAVESDVPQLVKMGQDFLRSTAYQGLIPENLSAMESAARMLIDRTPDTGVILVADVGTPVDSALVGMLGLVLTAHPISGESVASELWWWVDPAFRGITGIKLLRAAQQWAIALGANKIYMIAPDADVETLYRKMGYRKIEVGYQLVLNESMKEIEIDHQLKLNFKGDE